MKKKMVRMAHKGRKEERVKGGQSGRLSEERGREIFTKIHSIRIRGESRVTKFKRGGGREQEGEIWKV